MPQTRCPENVYFNPRSREGSDEDVTTKVDSLEISIHAPARGATVDPFFGSLDHVISIHAPARGATFGTLRSIPAASLFQSTLPRGERLAPVLFRGLSSTYFNPRSREGSDKTGSFQNPVSHLFQSTLPRGERLHECPFINWLHIISIHAPARGATAICRRRGNEEEAFQSTLPRGERQQPVRQSLAAA